MADIIVELDQQDHLEFDLKQEDQMDIDLQDIKAVVIGGIEYEEDPVDSGFVKYNAETEKYSTVAGDDTKLDKPTNFGSQQGIMRYNPTTGVIDRQPTYQGVPASGQVPIATTGGALNVGTPTADTHATNKKYVDDLADLKVSQIEYSKDQTFPDGSDAGVIGRAYIRFRDNTENSIVLNCQNAKYTIPVRDSVGNFYVGNPTQLYHTANKRYVDDKFNGANKAVSFENYSTMINSLNALDDISYNVGQNIMIVTLEVPDLWVSGIAEETEPYTYVNDDDFISELNANGTVQVGYYLLSALETQKVDLSELENKQDKLIAGENITIDENNVISATGGGLNIADLPKFTNKLYVDMSLQSSLAGVWTMPIYESGDIIVDWGDGSTTAYPAGELEISHTYADVNFAGWIYIYGDWQGTDMDRTSLSSPEKLVITAVVLDNNITNLKRGTFWGSYNIKSIVLPSTLKTIGAVALYKVYTGNMVLPNSITTIESSGVYIRDIGRLPSNLSTLNRDLFYSYRHSEIIIPESVSTIADTIFGYSAIQTVIFDKKLPNSISKNTFNNMGSLRQIIVPYNYLKTAKTQTNLTTYADKIYPKGGNYSEAITIPSTAWDTATNTVTVEAVGATSEDRNIITWNVSSGGVQIENTYGLKCTAQGTMQLTFSCETIPTEDVEVSVRYMLTNY